MTHIAPPNPAGHEEHFDADARPRRPMLRALAVAAAFAAFVALSFAAAYWGLGMLPAGAIERDMIDRLERSPYSHHPRVERFLEHVNQSSYVSRDMGRQAAGLLLELSRSEAR